MATATTRRRPLNPHAVAMRRLRGKTPPLAIYGDLTAAQRREHYSWVRRCGMSRAAGMPDPLPPAWVRMRALLHRYGHNQRLALIHEADRTADAGYQSIEAALDQLPPNMQTLIRANLAVVARAIYQLVLLAGVDEIEQSKRTRGFYGPPPNRG